MPIQIIIGNKFTSPCLFQRFFKEILSFIIHHYCLCINTLTNNMLSSASGVLSFSYRASVIRLSPFCMLYRGIIVCLRTERLLFQSRRLHKLNSDYPLVIYLLTNAAAIVLSMSLGKNGKKIGNRWSVRITKMTNHDGFMNSSRSSHFRFQFKEVCLE